MAIIKKYGDIKVIIDSLTFGYMFDVENGVVEETELGLVLDGTNLTQETLRKLTRIDVSEIIDIITKQTYPELFDKDGNRIISDDEIINDKKKV